MLVSILKDKKVKSVIIDDIEYFDVQDIKKHPELKIYVNEIVNIEGIPMISAEHIYLTTEFDRVIKQVFPKNKK